MIHLNNNISKNLRRTFITKIMIKRKFKKITNGRQEEITEDYFYCWCNPKDLYGKELYEAINVKFQNALSFELRYCEKIRLMREEMVNKQARFTIEFDGCSYEVYYIDFKNNSKDTVTIKANGVT